jgi:hypothetical protein
MALSQCPACQRHHDPATDCPFCAGTSPAPLAASLGGALLLAAATALGCVAAPAPGTPALIDTLPGPPESPTPTTPATTYGLPPARRRRK